MPQNIKHPRNESEITSTDSYHSSLIMLDIDGTLTQSYEYDREIFGLAIAEVLGCPPVDAELSGYVDKTSSGVTQEAIRRITGRDAKAEEIESVKGRVLWRLGKMYQESRAIFGEIPGARRFVDRLRNLEGVAIAIATGCWLSEALFKLHASGLMVDDIPMATSDDHWNRQRIMETAVEKARRAYVLPAFDHVLYIGDGPWDYQASLSLGYSFIGIGPRVLALKDSEAICWHQDFLEAESVLKSIAAVL
jgi:phosphoglycolate phosphatase-like HAD superfamily hydrolase